MIAADNRFSFEVCRQCGLTAIDGAKTGGLCPRCLMAAAVADLHASDHPFLSRGNLRGECPDLSQLDGELPQFEFQELLGGGGSGWVFCARQVSLDRLVAIKLLPCVASDFSYTAGRFEREAQILAKLNHPRIVTVFDYGAIEEGRYLVMEYVAGPTLREIMRSGPLEYKTCLQIIDAICEAVQYAHSKGVLHRDLKPENVLFASADALGELKVADFGISRLVGDAQDGLRQSTHTGIVLGTPYYAAPEQLSPNVPADQRADLFSIGVIFYELLTGRIPTGRFSPPSMLGKAPTGIDDVVMRCLENDPKHRFADVAALRLALATAPEKARVSWRNLWLIPVSVLMLAAVIWGTVAGLHQPLGNFDLNRQRQEVAGAQGDGEKPAAAQTNETKDPKKLENDLKISSLVARDARLNQLRLRLDCQVENSKLLETEGARFAWVVETIDGRRVEMPVVLPKGRQQFTLNETFSMRPTDNYPLEVFLEEQWFEPAKGGHRVSNVLKVNLWEVQPTRGGF